MESAKKENDNLKSKLAKAINDLTVNLGEIRNLSDAVKQQMQTEKEEFDSQKLNLTKNVSDLESRLKTLLEESNYRAENDSRLYNLLLKDKN